MGARGIEIPESTFSFDDQRCRRRTGDFAETAMVADLQHQFCVFTHVAVAVTERNELHATIRPIRLHRAERVALLDAEVLEVSREDAFAHLCEPVLPGFALPAVGEISVDHDRRVVTGDFHQSEEVVGAGGCGAGVDLVTEINTQAVGVLADALRFVDEAFLAFSDEIVARAFPEAPRIAGGDFETKGSAPEHGNDFDAQLGAEVEEAEDVILSPLLDFLDVEFGD